MWIFWWKLDCFKYFGTLFACIENVEQIKGYFTVTFFFFFFAGHVFFNSLKSTVEYWQKLAEKGEMSPKKLSIWFRNQQSQATDHISSIKVKIQRNKPFGTVWTMSSKCLKNCQKWLESAQPEKAQNLIRWDQKLSLYQLVITF